MPLHRLRRSGEVSLRTLGPKSGPRAKSERNGEGGRRIQCQARGPARTTGQLVGAHAHHALPSHRRAAWKVRLASACVQPASCTARRPARFPAACAAAPAQLAGASLTACSVRAQAAAWPATSARPRFIVTEALEPCESLPNTLAHTSWQVGIGAMQQMAHGAAALVGSGAHAPCAGRGGVLEQRTCPRVRGDAPRRVHAECGCKVADASACARPATDGSVCHLSFYDKANGS